MPTRLKHKKKRENPYQPVAVIDIGTSAVRLMIAQPTRNGRIRTLDSLQQAVQLGKDTFTEGKISTGTTEICVKALRDFLRILLEYDITDSDYIRAVATTAVREASNRDVFLNRLFIATGLHVELLGEEEGNRYTYMSVYSLLQHFKPLQKDDTVVVEVGSGSTEVLQVRNRDVIHAHTYRIGSLRLREMLERVYTSSPQRTRLMDTQIQRTLHQMHHDLHNDAESCRCLLALGGDARFAAAQINPSWDKISPVQLDLGALNKLISKILPLSVDEITRTYHITFAEAESIGPALQIYVGLAKTIGIKKFFVSGSSLRDGIIAEMTARVSRIDEFERQIIHSALELGRKYQFYQPHAENITELCALLFHRLSRELFLTSRYEILLRVAALLHEIGRFVGERAHHKHSLYLILNSEIFGLSARDRQIVALVARYHRKALPDVSHEVYRTLNHRDQIIVSKLAAMLRVASSLSRSRLHAPENVSMKFEPGRLIITIKHASDLSLEQFALQQKGQLFEQVFGRVVLVRTGK